MRLLILITILAPYFISRIEKFNSLGPFDLQVLALGSSSLIRDWKVSPESVKFLYKEALPGKCVDEVKTQQLCDAVVSHLDAARPDVIVIAGYGTQALRAGGKWARQNDCLSILMSESQWRDRRRNLGIEFLKGRWIQKHFDAAFVGGERNAAYLERLGFPSSQIWRGYDVVDNAYFEAEAGKVRKKATEWREKLQLPNRFFLYVGRFAPAKNLERLFEAYQSYREQAKGKPWDLVLVGSGPLEQYLKKNVAKEKMDGVHWPGFKQIDELPPYYALASCFILPSVSEPWGLVVNEAMASGLPILASDQCGCVPELVHPGQNGYIFDSLKSSELAYLMEVMSLGQSDLAKFGEESRRIVSRFTPQSWADTLSDCITMNFQRNGRK